MQRTPSSSRLMNALVWNESFTSADELCANSIFVRGSVIFSTLNSSTHY